MLRLDGLIRSTEVLRVITQKKAIEDYRNDARGHSFLLLGFGDHKRPIHGVCAPREDYLANISACLPDAHEWSRDFTKRVEKRNAFTAKVR